MNVKLLLIATIFFVSSCTAISPVALHIPEDPVLRDCPEQPVVEGRTRGRDPQGEGYEYVVIKIEDAVKLRDWIKDYRKCSEANQVILKGHVEKLKNRLRAVGGQ
jgi:hypothetical protein